MKKYTLLENGTYKNNETGFCNITPGNWMFKDVQKWLDEGNIPDPEFTEEDLLEKAWVNLRSERDLLLSATDWMMISDYFEALTEYKKGKLKEYRQALRDLPSNTEAPQTVSWPKKPAFIK